ncbi:MAG: hypothetical protein SF052_04935 [Bacteroidia bacterium]|nr:hypothetical protein [Bacteroidia bacterium]
MKLNLDLSIWGQDLTAAERGKNYFRQGKVQKLIRYGTAFSAEVLGTKWYSVVIDLHHTPPVFTCTCLYDAQTPCKHVFAACYAILEKQFIAEHPELTSEYANSLNLVNINSVRETVKKILLKDDYANSLMADLNSFFSENNFRNGMRYLLGIYEGMGIQRRENSELSAYFGLCMEKTLSAISPEKLSTQNAREMMDMIFFRWDKYEQLYDFAHPGKSFRYDFADMEPLMIALTRDKTIARFLEIKFSGYGLDSKKLALLTKYTDSLLA